MAKLVNLLFIITLLLSCKKKVYEVPVYLDADISFLEGTWEWRESCIVFSLTASDGFNSVFKDYVYSTDSSEACKLIFLPSGVINVDHNGTTKSMKLNITDLTQAGNIKIVSFRTQDNKLIRFLFDSDQNTLFTEFPLFELPASSCNNGFQLLTSSYEKI